MESHDDDEDDGKRRKKPRTSNASEKVSHNDDLTAEILYRLPSKSIFRFKCVCKRWLSLISHPFFPQQHSFHQPPPDSSISAFFYGCIWDFGFVPIDKLNTGLPDPSLSFLERNVCIVHSCNGLLLLRRYHPQTHITYCICNPTTKEFIFLPEPTPKSAACTGLAFDPSKSPHYKVICIQRLDVEDHLSSGINVQIDIYSSQTGLWRTSGVASTHSPPSEKVVFWNGGLHWAVGTEFSLSFDVEREFLQTTPLPPNPEGKSKRKHIYLGGSNGILYLMVSYDVSMPEFDILEMKHDYSQWFLRHHVSMNEVYQAYPEMVAQSFRPFPAVHLLLCRGGEVLWIHMPGKIISYRIRDRTFEKVCDISYHTWASWHHIHAYSNTLSSVRPSSSSPCRKFMSF